MTGLEGRVGDGSLVERGDERIIEALRPMISARRLARIHEILDGRSYNLTLILEGLCDTGNISAILRTADALGIQRIDLIQTQAYYKVGNSVSVGSHKWLDLHFHDEPVGCVRQLQAAGYRVLATCLDEGAAPISEVDFTGPVTLLLGGELEGVSPRAAAACDGRVFLPTVGFAQSLNVSVAAALMMYHGVEARRRALGRHGDLDPERRRVLLERFLRRTVRGSDLLVERLSKVGPGQR